jgi:hypothetical protein
LGAQDDDKDRPNWRKSKVVKNVVSDPLPVTPHLPSSSLPPPPPPPTLVEEETTSEEPAKQRRVPKIYQILGENPSLANVYELYLSKECIFFPV